MKRGLVVAAGSLVGVGVLALVGCASSMVPKNTRQTDSGITSVIQASLRGQRQGEGAAGGRRDP